MSKISWQKIFDTGIPQVDEQHKKLVSMINQLEDTQKSSDGAVDREVGLVLKKLVDYTQYHFSEEERLMNKIQYFDRGRHAEKHKELVNKVAAILKRLKVTGSIDVYELMSFLRDWLLDHIVLEDVKIGEAYREWDKTSGQSKPTISSKV